MEEQLNVISDDLANGAVSQYLLSWFVQVQASQFLWMEKVVTILDGTKLTTDCGVFVCMYCNFILNDCKLDFSQNNITNCYWQERMILSILLVKPKKDKESNNNDKVTISAIKIMWNH